jgi:hypothetical protein
MLKLQYNMSWIWLKDNIYNSPCSCLARRGHRFDPSPGGKMYGFITGTHHVGILLRRIPTPGDPYSNS